MAKLSLGRLLDEPFYHQGDFLKAFTQLEEDKKTDQILDDVYATSRMYHSLASYLSGLYNRKWKFSLISKRTNKEIHRRKIYNLVLDNISLIEQTYIYWIVKTVEPSKRTARIETIEEFAKNPLLENIARTKGVVPVSYANERNLETLIQIYVKFVQENELLKEKSRREKKSRIK